ncbi:DUF6942 family protein [Pokkaliibacter sp. CJK22405]|uniref:DUF6942 family protein n=1 Tax=Pokkaliibacter sp. CJK22405 TaxID=3384615 RepID=UPI0039847165
MPPITRLGSTSPRISLYLPHIPASIEEYHTHPTAEQLIATNSNHWRKIITIAAKLACPNEEWRQFRDLQLFRDIALIFTPELETHSGWHWLGGKDNQQRFGLDTTGLKPVAGAKDVWIDIRRKLLLTPYPDYRQLSNATIATIRATLHREGFYSSEMV